MSTKAELIQKVETEIKKLEGPLKKSCIALFSKYLAKLDIDEKIEKEEKEVERKFEAKYKPLYDQVINFNKSNELIEGKRAVTDAELKIEVLTQEEKSKLNVHMIPHRIENYWLKVLKNNVAIC